VSSSTEWRCNSVPRVATQRPLGGTSRYARRTPPLPCGEYGAGRRRDGIVRGAARPAEASLEGTSRVDTEEGRACGPPAEHGERRSARQPRHL